MARSRNNRRVFEVLLWSALGIALLFATLHLARGIGKLHGMLAKHLLCERHKALVVFQGTASYLDSARRSVRLRLPSIGEVEIVYDGFAFKVSAVSGDVFVNNRRVLAGDFLPGACVVALGAAEQKNRRKYITFDLSHPEIVL